MGNSKPLNYDPTDPDKMRLPFGVACGYCAHIKRCKSMFGHTETDMHCDWSPSRFVPARPDHIDDADKKAQPALALDEVETWDATLEWEEQGGQVCPVVYMRRVQVGQVAEPYVKHSDYADLTRRLAGAEAQLASREKELLATLNRLVDERGTLRGKVEAAEARVRELEADLAAEREDCPGGCAYWREAAKLREQERDNLRKVLRFYAENSPHSDTAKVDNGDRAKAALDATEVKP